MTGIMIEKNVPIPEPRRRKYPFSKMKIGDSFFIEDTSAKVRASASSYGKRLNREFITRREGNGVRCWRVK